MSDTPITDAALIERRHIHKRDGSVELLELVDADLARELERERDRYKSDVEVITKERDEARLQVKLLRVENNHNWQANDLAEQAFRERDEARDLAYKLYWVAWDLKRFARAYAGGYKEADDKEGVAKAEEDFYEACKDLVDVLGMDDE